MEKIWLVIGINTYSYDDTEMNTIICKTKEEALIKFNELSLQYLSSAKETYSSKYSVDADLSFSDYKSIAFNSGDIISVSCDLEKDEDKLLYIVNNFRKNIGYDEETFVVHMYPCVFGERDFSILSPIFGEEKSAEDFYKSLVK